MKFSIVVLHYMNVNDTINCVDSMLRFNKEYLQIIIVDNGSDNNTGDFLCAKYENISNVNVIISKENLGFSKGNNLGYKYALDTFDNDFIIFSNNDISITQIDFFEKIEKIYERTRFSVCGPDVFNPITTIHQSPFFINKTIDKRTINKIILRSWLKPFLNVLNTRKKENTAWKKNSQKACIHGAFIIFSRNYIDMFSEGIYSEIFMYGEEIILSYLVQKNNLVEYYSSEIQVNHFEEQSTNMKFKNSFKKYFFKASNETKSLLHLKKMME